MTDIKRQTAYKVNISEINNGKYVVNDGWAPNYISINGRKLSRASIIGTIIAKDSDESIIVDDGSGQILARNFENPKMFANFSLGDVVLVIGRPREYGTEKYLMSEIIKKTEPAWFHFRKKEIVLLSKLNLSEKIEDNLVPKKNESEETNKRQNFIKEEIIAEEKEEKKNEEEVPKTTTQKIIEFIQKNDSGNGVEIEEIEAKIGRCEETISLMIKRGDIFENKPGRVKLI